MLRGRSSKRHVKCHGADRSSVRRGGVRPYDAPTRGAHNLAVTANTYTHVLTDETELEYATLLDVQTCADGSPTGGEKSPLAGGFEPGTAHRDRLAERRPHSDAGRPHGGGPASADGSPTEVTPLFASVSSASLYDAGRAREQTRLVVEESGHGSPLTLPRRGELRLKTAAPRRAATFAFELGKLGDACATAACASRCLASTSTTRRWAASRSDTSSVRRSATGA